jgi:hypothetical protein
VFAVFRPIAAFVTGIFGGGVVNVFDKTESRQKHEKCTDDCCSGDHKNRITAGFKFAFVTLPKDIGKPMLIGIMIAAFISALVPEDFFIENLGSPVIQMLVMMVLGIPVYVCATASVPIAAALIFKGLCPGAALVFLMTGPATNAASFMIIARSLGNKTAILYLISVAICAFVAGFVLNQAAGWLDIENIVSKPHFMMPNYIKYICAVVLLGIIVNGIFFSRSKSHQ